MNTWIPVTTRVPLMYVDVLLTVIYEDVACVEIGCYCGDGEFVNSCADTIQRTDCVVAWMPLPEPYMNKFVRGDMNDLS